MDKMVQAVTTSLINSNAKSDSYYQHMLIDNSDHTMFYTLKKLLMECDEFYFSVAFITKSGVQLLKKTLIDIQHKGVKGKILTGNYLFFSDPNAMNDLNRFENIELKINYDDNLHTKGYFFKINGQWKIIVGSSNLTKNALMHNKEWNLLVSSLDEGKIVADSIDAFNRIYSQSYMFADVIDDYFNKFENKRLYDKPRVASPVELNQQIVPNKMQTEAIRSLEALRNSGERKAMIISATGSGKTYLSAFDVKKVNPKRCLFVVHSNTILEKAKETFKHIIVDKSLGTFNGECKEIDADYIFANIFTLSKDNSLNAFNRDEFDYIIIDEMHKAGANVYLKILDYFKSEFMLGMSATPERSDNYNIYELFDYNVAYEIRLKEAIHEDLIVPFHYYGVTDIYDNENCDVTFSEFSIDERVDNLLEKSELYGYDGDKVRGLIFVSRVSEAELVAKHINQKFYRAVSITGQTSSEQREDAIRRISLPVTDPNYIDYIVVVDVFNEGVDIPSINQVLLLRETESKIIYIQQIGRGLRKSDGKEYLVIIDFIGNYKNNFLISSALSGDNSFDLDKNKNIIIEGSSHCPRGCTLEFEQVAREIVLANINDNLKRGKASIKSIFVTDFKLLQQRRNKMPLLYDFYNEELLSPEQIVKIKHSSKRLPYHKALSTLFNYQLNLSAEAEKYLAVLYNEFSILKRAHEYIILRELLQGEKSIVELNEIIEHELNISNQMFYTKNAVDHLADKTFLGDVERNRLRELYGDISFIEAGDNIKVNSKFLSIYKQEKMFNTLITDLIEVNLAIVKDKYLSSRSYPLQLHEDYSKKEIYHTVGDDYNGGTIISGYRHFSTTNTVMIFVKFEGSQYENKLLSPQKIVWMSQNNKTYGVSELETDIADNKKTLQVFLRRGDGENHYYVGEASVESFQQISTDRQIIEYILNFKQDISDSLFEYLTEGY